MLMDAQLDGGVASAAQATVHQFGVDYYSDLVGPLTLAFDGADTVSLAGAAPREGRGVERSPATRPS
jgi:hypothetical protein